MGRQTGSRILTKAWIAAGIVLGVLLVGAVLAAAFAPFVYAELMPRLEPHAVVDPAPARIAKGRMFDDYLKCEMVSGIISAYRGAATMASCPSCF